MAELPKARNIVITKICGVIHGSVGPVSRTLVRTQPRPSHTLQLRLEGHTEYDFGENRYISERDDLLFIPKGSVYSVTNHGSGACISLHFHTLEEYDIQPCFVRSKTPARLRELFWQARRERQDLSPSGENQLRATLYRILSMLQKSVESEYMPSRTVELLTPAIALIEREEMPPDVSIEELAQACGIGVAYFRRQFTAVYGMAPSRYVIRTRMERAKRMLDAGESIRCAAEASGYTDVSYFTKVFKRETGMTPGEYVVMGGM